MAKRKRHKKQPAQWVLMAEGSRADVYQDMQCAGEARYALSWYKGQKPHISASYWPYIDALAMAGA